jgi:hypothetical protein
MGASPGIGEQAEQMRQGFGPQPLAGLNAAAWHGKVLPIERERHLPHDLPQRHVAKQGQTDHQPDGMVGRQFAAADGCFAGSAEGLLDPGGVDQHCQFGHPVGEQGRQGLIQCVLQQAHQRKRERETRSLFTACQIKPSLTDWH